MPPKDFPHWQMAYGRFQRWKREGRRTTRGHHRFPLGEEHRKRGRRGYDAGKKTRGRKQHIAVNAMGFLLAAVIHSTGIQDRASTRAVLIRLFRGIAGIRKIFADGGYTGKWVTLDDGYACHRDGDRQAQ
jgi:putative transposase